MTTRTIVGGALQREQRAPRNPTPANRRLASARHPCCTGRPCLARSRAGAGSNPISTRQRR